MIVADTNVIAYLLLPSPHTALAERLFSADPDWIAPILWRSEMRNVLALYLRRSLITLEEAVTLQAEAEALLQDKEYEVGARDVLTLVDQSSCSAYDCEFVALARSFHIKLVTQDSKITDAFPDTAVSPADFVAGRT
ncbi:MAG: type II toxin-antitoxin system VapC family toxin [Kiloniellales bacterium]